MTEIIVSVWHNFFYFKSMNSVENHSERIYLQCMYPSRQAQLN